MVKQSSLKVREPSVTHSVMPATPPRIFQLGELDFVALGTDGAQEFYDAVTSSEKELVGLFGTEWPKRLTWESNYNDLVRRAKEFDDEVAFSWVIRDASGKLIGSLYLHPDGKARMSGQVYLWLRGGMKAEKCAQSMVKLIKLWLADLGYRTSRYPIVAT